MSSLLHPVGPEAPQTYWIRRAVVVGAAVLALIVVIALLVSQNSSGSVVAQPTPSAVVPVPASPSTSPSPSPSVTATTASPGPRASATAGSTPAATSTPTPKAASPVACPAQQLRATITGDQDLVPGQPTTMSISLINGSATTCTVQASAANFELEVYSGVDRIWSSRDCAKVGRPLTKTLAPEESIGWKLTWDGTRSRTGCRQPPQTPQPGTYVATAQYAGAEPVQLRMTLRG